MRKSRKLSTYGLASGDTNRDILVRKVIDKITQLHATGIIKALGYNCGEDTVVTTGPSR